MASFMRASEVDKEESLAKNLRRVDLFDGNTKRETIKDANKMDETKEEEFIGRSSALSPEYFFKIGDLDKNSKPQVAGISDEQMEEIKQIFDVFDSDFNGQITANELRNVIRCLGQSTTEAEIMDMMHSIDSDGNGVIEFPEFLSLISNKVKNIKTNDQLDKVFKIFDTDRTNEINAGNLQKMFEIFGQSMTEKDIKKMLKEADINGDGKVDFQDFVNMMSG